MGVRERQNSILLAREELSHSKFPEKHLMNFSDEREYKEVSKSVFYMPKVVRENFNQEQYNMFPKITQKQEYELMKILNITHNVLNNH